MNTATDHTIKTPSGPVTIRCTDRQARALQKQVNAGDPSALFVLRARAVRSR